MKPSGVLHVIASMDPEKGGVGKAVRLIPYIRTGKNMASIVKS